jgi:hypothetical protein
MNYNFLIISIILSFVFSRETIKSKDIKPKPVNTIEIQNKAPNLKDKDLVKWSNEDKNINNPDYQYEMNKLMEQFKIEKGMIIQEFKRKIEPYKYQREEDMNEIKLLYSEKRKEIRQKYGIKRKPKNSDRKKIKKIDKSN